jgi:Cu2+-containing amine oxidase
VDTSNPNELVLTTVLTAGWYRYQLEYHFFPNGTFRPAAKWTAIQDPCLSYHHIHFIYWRLDYDIEGSAPNNIDEYNDIILALDYWNTPGWDNQFVEMTRQKDTFETRWWRARSGVSNRAYLIQSPSAFGDFINDDFAAVIPQIGDTWALRYGSPLQEETDDSGTFARYWIQIGKFIDYTAPRDNLVNVDVVFWYGAAHSHLGTGVPPPCDMVNGPYSRPDPAGPAW